LEVGASTGDPRPVLPARFSVASLGRVRLPAVPSPRLHRAADGLHRGCGAAAGVCCCGLLLCPLLHR
jgi:hypothetical protein